MSNYHLIPTFSFAPRHGHHQSRDQHQDVHPFQIFQMMDKIFEPGFDHGTTSVAADGGQCPALRRPMRRGFGELCFGENPAKFELMFDLGDKYKPDDVEVNVKLVDDDLLHIEARHETGSVESGEYRNHFFSKTVSLPEGTDVENLKSTLSDDGILWVEAPRKVIPEPKQAVREIQIQKTTRSAVEAEAAAKK